MRWSICGMMMLGWFLAGCHHDGVEIVKVYDGKQWQYFGIVTNPENSFQIVAQNVRFEARGAATQPVGAGAGAELGLSYSNDVVSLAERYDQLNSQQIAALKAALFGINSNPTSETNRDQFWRTIQIISRSSADLRKVSIVANDKGALSMVLGGGKSISTFQLSATGGFQSPWVDTGIDVPPERRVLIHASGRITTSMHHLIEAVAKHSVSSHPWVGPDGFSPTGTVPKNTNRPIDRYRREALLQKDQNWGVVLAYIGGPKPEVLPKEIHVVGSKAQFPSDKGGRLYLTVNEIWLDPEYESIRKMVELGTNQPLTMKDIFVPNLESNIGRDYYADKAKSNRLLRGKDPESEITPQEMKAAFEEQKRGWEQIVRDKYWNAWFEDNAGSFVITVELE